MKNGWEMVKLGRALVSRQIEPDAVKVASGEIPIISKIGFEKGQIELRNDRISNTKLISVYPNDLVLSGINAAKGAISINDLRCQIAATIHYSAYHVNEGEADLNYLLFYLRSRVFQDFLKFESANGLKTEIKPKKFLSFEIPLPPLTEQQRIAGRLAALKGKMDTVKGLRGEQEKEMKGLLLAQYRNIIEGAEWMPMKEVAPLVRRAVDLQPNTIYSEIGVRSFGKGVFEKPQINSDELTWQKPYWVKSGDLLMSNIKAWEGAVAAVGKEHDGKVGSHRYLTFVPDPEMTSAEFLAFHFLTDEGLLRLGEASPGSADRNRTLNTKIILNTLVPVPDIHLQNEFLQLQTKMEQLKAAQGGQLAGLEGLFPAVLEKAFRGEW